MDEPLIADQAYTIRNLLDRSQRESLPIERSFLQKRTSNNKPEPGPLASFVKRSRHVALNQYLVAHAIASGSDDLGNFDVRLPASAWARANGAYFDPDTGIVEPAGLHAVSRNWSFLEELGLIERERLGRKVRVRLLRDDGSGARYGHPGKDSEGKKLDGPGYFQLPYAYWQDGWHSRLSLPALSMLLIALSLGDAFPLPYEQAPKWYGISPSTAERGLDELETNKLIHREKHRRPELESPTGYVYAYHYELKAPFGPRNKYSNQRPRFWSGPPAQAKKGSHTPGSQDDPSRPSRIKEGPGKT